MRLGIITSSPGLTPESFKEMWRAEVPLEHAITYLAPVKLEISSSNLSTKDPADETHSVSRHSLTYFHSFPFILGTERGIIKLTLDYR